MDNSPVLGSPIATIERRSVTGLFLGAEYISLDGIGAPWLITEDADFNVSYKPIRLAEASAFIERWKKAAPMA